jgi:PrgI family protein
VSAQYSGAKIPADVERPDKVLAGFTARQVVILAVTFLIIYAGWILGQAWVPFGAYLAVAIPVAAGGIVLAVGRRDGIALDHYLRAALLFHLVPRHHHNPDTHPTTSNPRTRGRGHRRGHSRGHRRGRAGSPDPADPTDQGVPRWVAMRAHHTHRPPRSAPITGGAIPARGITTPAYGPADVGVLDLGGQGLALIAACSTVNFALRTETEQLGLIDCFARMLHAQIGPLQILVRSHPVDLTPTLAELAHAATTLTHPALRAAAAGHHRWLSELAGSQGLLARQVLIVLREPATRAHITPGHTDPRRAAAGAVDIAVGNPVEQAVGKAVGRAVAGAQARLVRRLAELRRALAPADITVTALSPRQLEQVLATNADPTRYLPSVPHPHTGPTDGLAWAVHTGDLR